MADAVSVKKGQRDSGSLITKILKQRELGVFLVLVLLCIIMGFASPYFWKPQNIFNILRNMSTIGIISIGMTMIIITGGIDLSVGSMVGAAGMVTARMMYMGMNPLLAVILGFAFGFLLGSINGLLITKVKVPPFIATLGMMSVARGLTYFFATGIKGAVASNVPLTHPVVGFMGGGYIGPIPFPVIEMIVLVIIFQWFLSNTVIGRQIYAVGSNAEAARLSGVNSDKIQVFVYTLTGGFCAMSGIISAGLLSTAATNAGTGTEMDVIAAVVIGGASLSGGEGSIRGAVVGAAIMAVIKNAFVLLHLPAFVQTITLGVVVVLAVAADGLRKKGQSGK
jgi:ribose transport system permease protein